MAKVWIDVLKLFIRDTDGQDRIKIDCFDEKLLVAAHTIKAMIEYKLDTEPCSLDSYSSQHKVSYSAPSPSRTCAISSRPHRLYINHAFHHDSHGVYGL